VRLYGARRLWPYPIRHNLTRCHSASTYLEWTAC